VKIKIIVFSRYLQHRLKKIKNYILPYKLDPNIIYIKYNYYCPKLFTGL
jgi:hypothetical protein